MKKDEITEWRVNKVQQFADIHIDSLYECFTLRRVAGIKEVLHGSEVEIKAHLYNWFYQGLENHKDYPLKDDKVFIGPWTELDVSNLNYGVVIAGMCLHGATGIKDMKKDTVAFREDIEFYIDYLQRLFGIYIGYHLAILGMKVKKRGSGKGQKDAMELRIKAISDVLLPRSRYPRAYARGT